MAAEAGLSVDEAGFLGLMAEQRQRAKADAAARKQAHSDLSAYRELVDAGPTEFTASMNWSPRQRFSASSWTADGAGGEQRRSTATAAPPPDRVS